LPQTKLSSNFVGKNETYKTVHWHSVIAKVRFKFCNVKGNVKHHVKKVMSQCNQKKVKVWLTSEY